MMQLKTFIKKIIRFFAKSYHKARASSFIRSIYNFSSKRKFTGSNLELKKEELRVAEFLLKDGIAITHIDRLFPENVFQNLESHVLSRWQDPDVLERRLNRGLAKQGDKLKSKDYFLVNLWKGDYIIDLDNPFIKFSLSKPIIDITNSYLGLWSKFRDFRLQVTVPMPEGDRRYASQEWHRDPEDRRLVKVFLYLNDIGENSGPFSYVKKSHEGGKWRHLFPQNYPSGSTCDPSFIEKHIPREDRIVCTGSAGTIIFCDTSGMHRGGFAESSNRFMYTSVYATPASVWPIIYRYPKSFVNKPEYPPSRYAVKNNPRKREPRFYKI